jgi:hypothetical protein
MFKTNEIFKKGKNVETLIPPLTKLFKWKRRKGMTDHEEHKIMA